MVYLNLQDYYDADQAAACSVIWCLVVWGFIIGCIVMSISHCQDKSKIKRLTTENVTLRNQLYPARQVRPNPTSNTYYTSPPQQQTINQAQRQQVPTNVVHIQTAPQPTYQQQPRQTPPVYQGAYNGPQPTYQQQQQQQYAPRAQIPRGVPLTQQQLQHAQASNQPQPVLYSQPVQHTPPMAPQQAQPQLSIINI